MKKRIAVLLAEGFEETEAVVPSDILRRLGMNVTLIGVAGKTVTGSHGIAVGTDRLLSEASAGEFDAVFLPGGLPGAVNLRDSELVLSMVRAVYAAGGIVSAICAAPIVLAKAGLVRGVATTGYPGTEQDVEGLVYTGNLTECDARIVTGKGPGAAFALGFRLAGALGVPQEKLDELRRGMFVTL